MHRADNLTAFMCRLPWNLRAWASWNPQGLSRPGLFFLYLYLYLYNTKKMWKNKAIYAHEDIQGNRVYRHSFLTSVLDGGEWSTSHWTEGWVGHRAGLDVLYKRQKSTIWTFLWLSSSTFLRSQQSKLALKNSTGLTGQALLIHCSAKKFSLHCMYQVLLFVALQHIEHIRD